jgi:uncharacterized protein involved in exopolysaccharide biosynthesis
MTPEVKDVRPVTVRDILYVGFKYKFQMLGIFLTTVVGALAYLICVSPTYEAETKVLVQLGKERAEPMEMTTTKPNVVLAARPEDIRDEIEILKDKNVIYTVMPKLQEWLDKAPRPPESILRRIRAWISDGFRLLKELAYEPLYALGLATRLTPDQRFALALQSGLDAEAIEQTDVIKLKFRWSNPQFAAFAANALADEYVRRRTEVYATDEAQRFYSDQIQVYQERLVEIEHAIEQYRKQRNISNLDLQRELLLKEISELERNFTEAGSALKDLEVKLDSVRLTFDKTDDWLETPIIGGILPDMTALDQRYFDAFAERNRLLETDTPKSRAVQTVTTQMAKLRAQKFQSLEDFIQSQVGSVTKRQKLYTASLAEKRNALAALDQSARTLREMERQRDLTERDYKEYSNKAGDFRISAALNKQQLSSVRILGPALPPEKPAKPWVTVVMTLAVFLGLFLAFLYATVSEYFDHTLGNKEDVEAALGIPLLAAIPEMKYESRARG